MGRGHAYVLAAFAVVKKGEGEKKKRKREDHLARKRKKSDLFGTCDSPPFDTMKRKKGRKG